MRGLGELSGSFGQRRHSVSRPILWPNISDKTAAARPSRALASGTEGLSAPTSREATEMETVYLALIVFGIVVFGFVVNYFTKHHKDNP